MKTKASKQPNQSKPAVQLKDIKPKKDATGGRTKWPNLVLKQG